MATENTKQSVPVEQVGNAEDITQNTETQENAIPEQTGIPTALPVESPQQSETRPEEADSVQVADLPSQEELPAEQGMQIHNRDNTPEFCSPAEDLEKSEQEPVEEAPIQPEDQPEPAVEMTPEETNQTESGTTNEEPAGLNVAEETKTPELTPTDGEVPRQKPEEENSGMDFSEEEAIMAADAPEFDLGEATTEETEGSDNTGFDLAGKSKDEILDIFATLLAEKPVQSLRRNIEAIKVAFYKIHRAEEQQQKKEFIDGGGNPEDFSALPDPAEQRLKDLFAEYRRRRDEFIANLERSKEDNLKVKQAIIEDLKELINSSETLNNTFNSFRELQQRWREAGPVPQGNVKDLWETYNHHVENFYSFIKINKELRDLDLKKNYEAKVALCEEAETLILEPSIVNAFHKLQKLHEQWRETGPVANEYKEVLWDRFKEASSRINKQHQDYFERLKDEQKANLDLKTELCVKTEELVNGVYTSRKDWNKASEKLLEIQKIWKTIGFAPKKDNTRIYERFRQACDRFFEQKRNFYTQLKTEMDLNLQIKTEICESAEALQNSEEWKKTTDELIALQKKWKEIGPVARRHSDAVWKRFRAACDSFFEKKSKHFSSMDAEHEQNLQRKKELLAEIEECDIMEGGFDMIKDFQRRWSEIGFVPIKHKEAIQKEYKAVMDRLFSTLRGSEQSRQFDRFKGRVQNMKTSGDRRLRNERDRLYNRVKQLESDIALLENNIGFFSKSKNAEAMIKDVRDKIQKAKDEMTLAIEKINLIDKEQE